ncbi:UDP-N-acetylmuramoyl-L-alanine--D-glutamate ligase, partial [Candidatus Uhrbacteria bacterium]
MKVMILGLGQYPKGSGVAAALYFARRKDDLLVVDPYYTVAMAKNVARLKRFKNVKFVLGKHATGRVRDMDLVVRHQRIRSNEPELKMARKHGVPIESELSVFLEACPAPVVGVTGTRGKSTTTALLHSMLEASKRWRKTWLGGNILVSPLTYMDEIKERDIVVLEMSSFQLEGLGEAGRSPQIALLTNLMRDHLNTYASMEEYAEAKVQIFRHQSAEDLAILPAEKAFDAYASEAPGSVYRWGKKGSPEVALVQESKLKIMGAHNVRNAEAAAAVALLLGVKKTAVKKSLESFKGLENRQEIVAVKRGITFVNDTTSTTPDATIAAVRVFRASGRHRVHLIFGGADKELEFGEIARVLGKRK